MWKIIIIGFLGGMLILACNIVISKIIQYCFNYDIKSETNFIHAKKQKVTINVTNKKLWPVYLLFIILEEYLYRFMLMKYLNQLCSSLALSILISTVVFTFVHIHYKYKMIQVFIMGLILCGTYIMSDSIVSPIISHSINNFIVIYFLKDDEKKY